MSNHDDRLEFLKEIKESNNPPSSNTVLSWGNNSLVRSNINWAIANPKPVAFKIDFGGSEVILNTDGTVEIKAPNGIKFKTDGDLEFDAKTVKVNAKEDIELGSANNISQQAPTIHLNPDNDASGYKGKP